MSWSPVITEVIGRFVNASNATLLAGTADGDRVVYKPTAGEQPLWDFPVETLAAREVLTYEVSQATGFDVVPETVLGDGPYGLGAIQRFVDLDPHFNPLELVEASSRELWRIAVLDLVTNNADRKLGHIISDGERLLGIDHGLTFHPDDKLRTVLWVFAGMPIPAAELEGLARLRDVLAKGMGERVAELLGDRELRALTERVESLLATPIHPDPPTDRPAVPWPPY